MTKYLQTLFLLIFKEEDKMDSLGQFLKKQRELKGYSLHDAQEETKIQIKYLKALEEENFNILPGEVFTKGFIRSYADFLGINPQEAMDRYYNLKGEKQEEIIENEESTRVTQNKEVKATKEEEPSVRPKISPVLLFLAIGIIVLGIWVYNAYKPNPDNQGDLPIQEQNEQPNNQPEISKPKPEPKQQVTLPAPVYVRTIVTDTCWTQVKVDGKLVFEGQLTPGTIREWKGQQQITFRFGNAGGIKIEYNGKNLGQVGAKGEVVDKVFTPTQVVE